MGDVEAVDAFLASDPTLASREGGPFHWEPLVYLTYSRVTAPGGDPPRVARRLLTGGADPNAGYLWEGLPSPITALTGVFGRGEQGAPPHAQELPLARLLLEAGADANDSQTIYNRGAGDLARDDTEFLALLLDFGLGRGDGGPWRRRLGHEHQSPTEIVAEALQHAAEGGLPRRAQLLLARGADPNEPASHSGYEGRSPYEGAVLHGNLEIAALLARHGADADAVDDVTTFAGSCMAGDRVAVRTALAADTGLVDRSRERHSDLIGRAAERRRPAAVRLLVELGFDIDACPRITALHEASFRGDLAMVKVLIALGADPTIEDTSYHSPPRGWAAHNGHPDVVEYLDRITGTT